MTVLPIEPRWVRHLSGLESQGEKEFYDICIYVSGCLVGTDKRDALTMLLDNLAILKNRDETIFEGAIEYIKKTYPYSACGKTARIIPFSKE